VVGSGRSVRCPRPSSGTSPLRCGHDEYRPPVDDWFAERSADAAESDGDDVKADAGADGAAGAAGGTGVTEAAGDR
jgi:hypothetical protein